MNERSSISSAQEELAEERLWLSDNGAFIIQPRATPWDKMPIQLSARKGRHNLAILCLNLSSEF